MARVNIHDSLYESHDENEDIWNAINYLHERINRLEQIIKRRGFENEKN